VSSQGNRARINVQLIKASDGFNLWSNTYDREMSDIFAVQDSIASAVTEALKVKLLGTEGSGPSTNVEAYDAYLQGRYFLARRNSRESRAKAVSYFERAIRLDPRYAPAWAGLADCRIYQAQSGDIEEGYQQARESVTHALTLDPNLGYAHSTMGRIKMLDWDWGGAEASFQLALAFNPGDAVALRAEGALARMMGRLDESIRLYGRATEIEPLNGSTNLGIGLHYAGRQEEAKTALEKALELNPEIEAAHTFLARVYLAQSRPREALDEAEKENDPAWRLYGLALTNYALGRKKESDGKLAELIAKHGKDATSQIAGVYAYRGEVDRAFEWLERAYTEREQGLAEMKADPLLKSLVRDPRYTALLKRIGLPL
jgi:tetratricopeptide (TPR) repeat protein